MNIETTDALNRINQRFYTAIADDFSATRRDPWPGWSRAVRHLRCGEGVAPRVLDLGCGNGRFANFLEAEWGPHYHYLGIDSSEGLLGHARTALSGIPRVEFDLLDFLPDTGTLELPEGHFDLVALFGVLHHVPGFEMRRALLRALADLLTPGGTLIIAAWQFGSEARFQSRILPWEQYNAGTREPIDLGALRAASLEYERVPFARHAFPQQSQAVRATSSARPFRRRASTICSSVSCWSTWPGRRRRYAPCARCSSRAAP